MEKHLTFHIQTKCILGNPHILILHKGVEVLGVAEAWVPGGDQGQLGEAGKLDALKFNSNWVFITNSVARES